MTFTCISQPCTSTKLEAKGMCGYHYKRTRPRTPNKPRPRACTGCGVQVERLSSSRYTKTYCSELCRHWVQWGAWSSVIPTPHRAAPPKVKVKSVPATHTCEWCGKQYSSTHARIKYCSRSCLNRAGKARRRGREFNAIGTYSWAELTRLWSTFGKACAYCRKATALPEIQAEHVQALSMGGANNLTNLLPSCGACNSDKRQLSLTEWATDRARRNLPAVVTSWDVDEARYSHLTTGRTLIRMVA